MTVGLDGAAVEDVLGSGLLRCPVLDCGEPLARWGWARGRVVRGAGRLRPRRARCRGCRRTQVLLPASVLLRRADAVTVIGAALLAKAGGAGHRRAAVLVGVPVSTVRGWLRRITAVADRVLAVLAASAAEFGVDFLPPAAAAGPVGAVVELVGALARAAALRLGGSCVPWRLAAYSPAAGCCVPHVPELVAGQVMSGNTSSLWAAGPSPGGVG